MLSIRYLLPALLLAGPAAAAEPPASGVVLDPASVARTARRVGLDPADVEALHRGQNLDLRTLERLPGALLARARRKLEEPKLDHPGKAFEFLLDQRRSDDGHVRPDGLVRAVRELARIRAALGPGRRVAGVPVGAEVRGLSAPRALHAAALPGSWRWIGPGNIGGRTRTIAIHPDRPRLMWAGSAGGGIWRSRDAGASWQPLTDLLASLSVSTVILDPVAREGRERALYAGTGEGFFGRRGVQGVGVFVSRDLGDSWEHLPATGGLEFGYVNRLAFTADGGALLAATHAGVWVSRDGGASFEEPPAEVATTVLDLDCHPTDPRRCVASGNEGDAWTTADGGRSWVAARGLPALEDFLGHRRVEVCYARGNPEVVYASVDVDSGVIYRSADGGRTFAPRRTAIAGTDPPEPVHPLGRQGWYDNIVWAGDPRDPDLVIVGGINLWRSRDGGDTFEKISRWQAAPESAHADHHFVVAHPGYDGVDNRVAYFGNDGGVYRTDDVHEVGEVVGWVERNTNYGVTQFYGAAWNGHSGSVFGGTQDHGNLRYTPAEGPHAWHQTITGDGGYCAWDAESDARLFGEYIFLHVERSEDDGETADFICGLHWDGRGVRWKEPPYVIEDARDWRANFIAPIVLDPNDPRRLLGGGDALWVTPDARAPTTEETGPEWRRIKPGIEFRGDRNFISAIELVPGRPGEVWVGHNGGQVFRSRDAFGPDPRWEPVSTRYDGRLPQRPVLRVRVDPARPRRVFLAYGGFDDANVWESTDGGATFRPRAAGLVPVPVRDIAIHPEEPAWLYAGTALGLFVSADGGASWVPTDSGPVNVAVTELRWIRGGLRPGARGRAGEGPWELLVVTYGRGMFAIRPRR